VGKWSSRKVVKKSPAVYADRHGYKKIEILEPWRRLKGRKVSKSPSLKNTIKTNLFQDGTFLIKDVKWKIKIIKPETRKIKAEILIL